MTICAENSDFLTDLELYDYQKEAGLLHVADHHYSPGKKQWTWGCGDFGKAWDRNLTDEDGPYIELMCGVFTDNQPDFTWLKPFEEKTFTQYFMPYKKVGQVKNATIDAAVNLELTHENLQIKEQPAVLLIKLVTQLDKILYNVHEQYNSFLGNVVLVDDIIPKRGGIALFICKRGENPSKQRISSGDSRKKVDTTGVEAEEKE